MRLIHCAGCNRPWARVAPGSDVEHRCRDCKAVTWTNGVDVRLVTASIHDLRLINGSSNTMVTGRR